MNSLRIPFIKHKKINAKLAKIYFAYGVVVFWIVASFAGLIYFTQASLVWFDPQATLYQRSIVESFDQQVATEFESLFGSVKGKVFHIKDSDCSCNLVSKAHIATIDRKLKIQNLQTEVVNIREHPQLETMIPSTPSVVMFNLEGDLTYVGPYAAGAVCTSENSFVEKLIVELLKPVELGAIVVTEVKGCYCNVGPEITENNTPSVI